MTTCESENHHPESQPLPPKKQERRSRQLDFLRGVAIILVLAIHLHLEIPDTPLIGPFFQFFHKIGWVGVDLFFVLSGFLVGGLIITEQSKYGRIDAKRFLIRRGLKIYPLYYLFFAYLFANPLLETIWAGEDFGTKFGVLWHKYWPNLLFLNGYFGSDPIAHTWTLAIEEHFYIILPFFLVALSSRLSMKKIALCCAAITIPVVAYRSYAVLSTDQDFIRTTATHFRVDALFMGVAIRAFAAASPERFASLRRYRYPLIVLGFALLFYVPFMGSDAKKSIGYFFTVVSASAILIGTFHLRFSDIKFLRPFANKTVNLMCWVGTYSYAIYLWHVTIFRIIETKIDRMGFIESSSTPMLTWIATAFVICAIAVLASAFISRIVEVPVLKFRDRFFPSRSTSIPTTATKV